MHLLPRNKTAHPLTYKAWSFPEKDAKLEEIIVQWKDPAPDQVVVKVLACGVCGRYVIIHLPLHHCPPNFSFNHITFLFHSLLSDELVQRGALPYGFPRIPGHEIIGEIIARGPNVTNFKLGQRVGAGWHGGQCGVCESCRVGDFITCENQTINGVSVDGGYAEYATLRTDSLAVIPEGMDPVEAAPLFCAGVTCFSKVSIL